MAPKGFTGRDPDDHMEDVDGPSSVVASNEFTTQVPLSTPETMHPSDSEAETTSDIEFITVNRRRRHWLMMPAAAITTSKHYRLSTLMIDITQNLRKIATIIGEGSMEYLCDEDSMILIPTVVFEVGSRDQLEASLQCGFEDKDEYGKTVCTHYEEYTNIRQTAQERRIVTLNNIAWNTKANQVHAVMAKWGRITSVVMGFNKAHSMQTARVIFAHFASVEKMEEEKVTYVVIGRDSGAVTQLGTTPCTIDRDLTMKLANLPLCPTHQQPACDTFKKRQELQTRRKTNAKATRGAVSSPTKAVSPTKTTSQTTPMPKSSASLQSSASVSTRRSTAATSSSNMDYRRALTNKGKDVDRNAQAAAILTPANKPTTSNNGARRSDTSTVTTTITAETWQEKHAAMEQRAQVLRARLDQHEQEWKTTRQRVVRLESKIDIIIELLQKQQSMPTAQLAFQDNEMEDASPIIITQTPTAPSDTPVTESAVIVGKRHYRSLSGSDGSVGPKAAAKMDKEQAIAQLQRELEEANARATMATARAENAEKVANSHFAEVQRVLEITAQQKARIDEHEVFLQRLQPTEGDKHNEDL
ncbi:hypothetical protein BGZ54_004019 [Gamsiella multidivaricata]|nr:hypothetical protein BGZ54_004019 [Gamsiella multidivaricata]